MIDCAPLTIDENLIEAQEYINNNDSYTWTFTDINGNVLTTSNTITPPTYVIPNDDDTVIVTLQVNNVHGCVEAVEIDTIITIDDPIAEFTTNVTEGCHPLIINTDTTANSTNGAYNWVVLDQNGNTFNSSNSNNVSTPSFTLTNNSNTLNSEYTIILTVGDPATGCSHSDTIGPITVYPKPLAQLTTTPNTSCANEDIQADGNTSVGNNLTYNWSVTSNWGVNIDNNISSNPIISFPDNQSGTDSIYNIQVIVTSNQGCQDTTNQDVTIYTRPIALFDIDSSICGPNTISPINNSSFATNYTWSVDQNGTINNPLATQPNFTFPENLSNDSIVYTIELIATSIQGCQDTIQEVTTVYPRPEANIIPTLLDSCGPFTIEFINNSIANNNEPINSMSFTWTVDGITQGQQQNFTFDFLNANFNDTTYTVGLNAQTQHGCQDDTSFYSNSLSRPNSTNKSTSKCDRLCPTNNR